MLRYLSKQVFIIQLLLYLVIMIFLWLPEIMHPPLVVESSSEGPLFRVVRILVQPFPLAAVILTLFCVLSATVLFYYLLSYNDLIARENFVPAIFALILLSWNKSFAAFQPIVPALLLMLYTLYKVMKIYGQQEPYKLVFSSTFSIGLASLVYLPGIYLLPMIWFSFITYRITTWREWFISIIGFSIPMLYLLGIFYLNDQFAQLFQTVPSRVFHPGIDLGSMKGIEVAWLIVTLFILLISSFGVMNGFQDKLISQRRKVYILINLLISVFILAILTGTPIVELVYLFCLPLSAFVCLILTVAKKSLVWDLIATAYLLFLIVLHMV